MFKKIFAVFLISFILIITACTSNTKPVPQLTPDQITKLYNPRGNVVLGNPNGKKTLVEIFDYQCEYCRKMVPVIQKLVDTDPDVRVVLKEIVMLGPDSEPPTRAALAAQKQNKYQVMRNALMTATAPLNIKTIMQIAQTQKLNTKKLAADMTSTGVTQQISENGDLINQLNLDSIPVFIITNSDIAQNPNSQSKQLMLVGQTSVDELEKLFAKVANQ